MNCRILACLAAAAMLIIGVPGCSTPGPVPPPAPPTTDTLTVPDTTSPVTSTEPDTGSDTGSGAVTGTVTWPDGNLAANVKVYFVEGDWHVDTYQPDVTMQLGPDASYSIGNCPCQGLTAYLYVPADLANGSQDCYILMQAQGTYSGVNPNPGDVINWQALDMPCDVSPYPSDLSAVQNEATALASGGFPNTGSWQAAEARAGGA